MVDGMYYLIVFLSFEKEGVQEVIMMVTRQKVNVNSYAVEINNGLDITAYPNYQ